MKLTRLSRRPVLEPDPDNYWEAGAVYNCAAVRHQGLVYLIYRATDVSSSGSKAHYISRLGFAVSGDGLHFNRLAEPVLGNDVPQEGRGPEDPRIVKIDGIFYMTYTGYGGRFDGDYRICLASSKNLIEWQRHGVVLDESNKDASLFPRKIAGRYWMFHRRPPSIWLAASGDLMTWGDHREVMAPVGDSRWENLKIGIAGPPIEMEDGWLLIYHGVNHEKEYRLGAALLDREDPGRVLARLPDPILEPELDWEREGHVPNVVFSCGQVVLGETLVVYYGGADTVIGAAAVRMSDIHF